MQALLRAALVVVAVAAACPSRIEALSFRVIENDGFGAKVLLIYDCGRVKETRVCTPQNRRFDGSDPDTLSGYWRQGPFDEVWLLSGGGAVSAGIGLANDFRAHRQAVRVPGVARLLKAGVEPARAPACVSSCTLAFMGGQFRTVDEGATYQVHASSTVSWGDVSASMPAIAHTFDLLKAGGSRGMLTYWTSDMRKLARDLFVVFQDTLWLPIKPRNPRDPLNRDAEWSRREQAFNEWLRERQAVSLPYTAAQQARDEALLALEGPAALQDIIMREERMEMIRAINEIRTFMPRLGRRADAALAMLAAMYETSSILETNSLPRETLMKMGYVTEFVK